MADIETKTDGDAKRARVATVPRSGYPFGAFWGLADPTHGPSSERLPAAKAAADAPVRRATPRDAATIEAMLRAMAAESPVYREMKIDDGRLAGFIAKAIGGPDHVVLLHERAGEVDGLYIGLLVQQFFTLEFTAMDILFYVRPERRGGRAAVRLWRAFRQWAEERGATGVQVGTMTEIAPARTAKFYRGMGLNEIGGVFHARIK